MAHTVNGGCDRTPTGSRPAASVGGRHLDETLTDTIPEEMDRHLDRAQRT